MISSSPDKTIILATSNAGKIIELKAILSSWHCISQEELGISSIEETGLSFVENALLKARHVSAQAKKPALADDSGLVVPLLQGEPGLFSARYAGPHATDADNIALLLNKLRDVPPTQRHAFFYCAIALIQHENDPMPLIATGKVAGVIVDNKQGDNGFGYDPIFYLPALGMTMAELSKEVKNTLSHRAHALEQLRQQLKTYE